MDISELCQPDKWRLCVWLLSNSELSCLKDTDLLSSSEGCMKGYKRKLRPMRSWTPPEQNIMKFNVDGAARRKPGPQEIGGVLRNHKGTTSIVFSESVGVGNSNEAEILKIRRALTIKKTYRQGKLIIKGDSANAIKWAKGQIIRP